MTVTRHLDRHHRAADNFNEIQHSQLGEPLVESMSAGLNVLRELTFLRIHHDVEHYFGLDSMCVPLSLGDSEREAKVEIDIWQIVEATLFAHSYHYVDDEDWMRKWLGELRLGNMFANPTVERRVQQYWELDAEDRRRHFSQILERVYPEASRAPLVLYQLLPSAVRIVVAIAFGQTKDAQKLRQDQAFWLPGIMDCQMCHGSTLENGECCSDCRNPVWTYQWLTSAD